MRSLDFCFAGAELTALSSGALWWKSKSLLCVSDLHLGKSGRLARLGGSLLPPYETHDTLEKLDADIRLLGPETVICLGDSFDDLTAAENLREIEYAWLTRLAAGRRWVWIEGNHDPGPIALSGEHLSAVNVGPLGFRHIATSGTIGSDIGEVSGHFHPKAKLPGRGLTRPCFLFDAKRLILPAYGTYTGGLRAEHPTLCNLMGAKAKAILLAAPPVLIPMPRGN